MGGLTLQGVGALGGGAAEGYLAGQSNMRLNDKSARANAEENRAALGHKQTQEANAMEAERIRREAEIAKATQVQAIQQATTDSMQRRARID